MAKEPRRMPPGKGARGQGGQPPLHCYCCAKSTHSPGVRPRQGSPGSLGLDCSPGHLTPAAPAGFHKQETDAGRWAMTGSFESQPKSRPSPPAAVQLLTCACASGRVLTGAAVIWTLLQKVRDRSSTSCLGEGLKGSDQGHRPLPSPVIAWASPPNWAAVTADRGGTGTRIHCPASRLGPG